MKLHQLFANNRAWSEKMTRSDSGFFRRLAEQQSPKYLWIGCSDSRVPANEIVGLLPGELFVHRNVANLVVHTDLNCLSVIQFSVDVLKVEHIIVCGHYGCGGVRAVVEKRDIGLANNWLRHLADVRDKFQDPLKQLPHDDARADKLCELNIIEQVRNVCESTIVTDAWKKRQPLTVHGWVYGLEDGLLRDLLTNPINSIEESLRI
ncbi:MAG: Carbonic anhydrase 2 [Elusimicrobia bacterium]|nr:Carbonic anhydrase 2 [Elusimicrobiota bacterium]